jgi:shikimate kinase
MTPALAKPNRKSSRKITKSPASAVILVGFMGAGKTSVGRALAGELGWIFEDLDDRIEQREQRTVAEIFRDAGENAFRRAEHSALQELLRELTNQSERIIALGGGAFIQENNSRLIEAAKVPTIFLDADVDELWGRCSRQMEALQTERPLLGSLENFRDLYESRRPHYRKASFTHSTTGKSVSEIAAEIVRRLGLHSKSRKRGDSH